MEVYLIYTVVLISAVQQSNAVLYIYIYTHTHTHTFFFIFFSVMVIIFNIIPCALQ